MADQFVRTYLIFMWAHHYPVGGIHDLRLTCHGTIDDAMKKARDYFAACSDGIEAIEIVQLVGPLEAPTFRAVLRCDPAHFDLRWDAPREQEDAHG